MGKQRPPGSVRPISPKPIPVVTKAELLMPLDYLLSVVRDPTASQERRDRLASVCLPYCHPRVAERFKGRKDEQSEAAETAGIGTPWAADVGFDIHAN